MDKRLVKRVEVPGIGKAWAVVLPDGTTGAHYWSRSVAIRESLKALEASRAQGAAK